MAGEDDASGLPLSAAVELSLVQRPLRIRAASPVLAAGRAYSFSEPADLPDRPGTGARRRAGRAWSCGASSAVTSRPGAADASAAAAGSRSAWRSRSSRVLVFRVRARNGDVVACGCPSASPAAAHRARVAPGPAWHAIGGVVPSYLSLSLDEPSGFATFPAGPGSYELQIRARVTASDSTRA